jgi:hypothetical protein
MLNCIHILISFCVSVQVKKPRGPNSVYPLLTQPLRNLVTTNCVDLVIFPQYPPFLLYNPRLPCRSVRPCCKSLFGLCSCHVFTSFSWGPGGGRLARAHIPIPGTPIPWCTRNVKLHCSENLVVYCRYWEGMIESYSFCVKFSTRRMKRCVYFRFGFWRTKGERYAFGFEIFWIGSVWFNFI